MTAPRDTRKTIIGCTAVVGAAAVVTGVLLPWVSTFAGLISLNGWSGSNGRLLLAGGLLEAFLAVAFLRTGRTSLHWAIGLVGAALLAASGYLALQLMHLVGSLDGMSVPAAGPGLFVVVGGSLSLFITLLLPPAARSSQPHRRPQPGLPASPSDGITV